MTEKDPFEQFFDDLDDKIVEKTGTFSSTEDSDPEEKAKAFYYPVENDNQEQKDQFSNEPEYVLPPDHSKIDYPPISKNIQFSGFSQSISKEAIGDFFDKNQATVSAGLFEPLLSLEFFKKIPRICEFFTQNSIDQPTAVQSLVLPISFQGYNMIVVSPTGTGKTLAFLLPLLFKVRQVGKQAGPVALIVSPTEILAHQTATVLHQLIDPGEFSIIEITNRSFKFKQVSMIQKGIDIIIATPGRLMNFLTQIDWKFCTFFVVDEADKIFETGFFRQLRSIFDYIRPDRQTLLFGATLPNEIEDLSRNSLKFSIRVQIGQVGAPQQGITHNFVIVGHPSKKKNWLIGNIDTFDEGQVIIFVKDKAFCEKLYQDLRINNNQIIYVHGHQSKEEREKSLGSFIHGKNRFLITTEIAARGLDVPSISTVVNYDIPEKPQNYVHRVGRTARAGRTGVAYTLLSPRDIEFAEGLLIHFKSTGIDPPENLIDFVNETKSKFDITSIYDI